MTEQGAVAVALENAGPDEFYEAAYPQMPDWPELYVTGLFDASVDTGEIVDRIQSLFTECDRCSVSRLVDRDWERSWLSGFEPIQAGRNLWVCPSWISPPHAEAVNVIIDPGLAFGTGTHPTTAMCLEWLDRNPPAGNRVVDVGCGSGILAIAALKLGASHAWGIDVDPRALKASRENAERNGVAGEYSAGALDEVPRSFSAHLLMANILAGVLVGLKEHLVSLVCSDGVMLLTGILHSQAIEVQNTFASNFQFEEMQREEWSMLIAKKR